MKEKRKINYIRILVFFLCVMGAVKILFVGYDIDEEYALAMSYRMTQGDFMIYNMWEPHQTSGFLMALFMLPYLMITGTTTGIALFVRICGLVCHIIVHILFYKTLASYLDRDYSLLVSGISFFVLPKLMFVPEFSNMQIWFLILTSICLLKYYGKEKIEEQRGKLGYLIAAGFFTALEVFTYPSTIFAFFGVVFFIVLFRRKGLPVKELVAYILPCISSAAVVIFILLTKIPLDKFSMLIKQATSDGSHSTTVLEWFARQGLSWLKILAFMAVYALLAWIIFLILTKSKISVKSVLLWPKLWILCALIGQVIIWLYGNRPPNYPSVEYVIVLMVVIVAFCRRKIKNTPAFVFLVVIPFLTFPGIVLFSNHPLMVSLPFLGTCAIGCLSLPELKDIFKMEESNKYKIRYLTVYLILLTWFIIIVFGKCYRIRVSGGYYYNAFHEMALFRDGVAKGIIADEGTVLYGRDVHKLIVNNLPQGAKVLYIGNYSDIYLISDMVVCTPSTISTPTYGENVDLYYELYPEKRPEYVVFSNNYISDLDLDWINSYIKENCEEMPIAEDWCIKIYQCK